MSTITTFVTIGNSHPNDGILWGNIHARLEVTENSKMGLHLHSLTKDGKSVGQRMLPSIENTIYDAFVLLAYVFFNCRYFQERALTESEQDQYIDINVEDPKQLNLIYEAKLAIMENTKYVVSILNGSTLLGQLPLMKKLPFSLEERN